MELVANINQISTGESTRIKRQVQSELVDHLYEGCLPGTLTGVLCSIAYFLMFYGYTPLPLLIAWVIVFNLMLSILTGLYFVFLKFKNKISSNIWQWAYSVAMTGCALVWVPSVLLMPENTIRQFLALIAIFMVATAYAVGTIGQFYLCIVTVSLIVLPVTIWCFITGGVFHNLVGLYSILYTMFMFGANLRSTRWFHDSIKLKLENILVSYQANHDSLTGLPNQRLLAQYMDSAIQLAKKTQETFAFICFSLNRLEIINDSLGHEAGDIIIQSVTKRLSTFATLQKPLNYIITLSRKDTFNILLTSIQQSDIEVEINKLFSVLDEPFYLENRGVKVTASIGVSLYPKDGSDMQTLLINADAAMLKAKQFGSNRLEFYRSEINAQLPKRLELESELHIALTKNQFDVFYQPLIDLSTNSISGMEALIRWKHPERGYISPGNFIPLAEETGLIVPIGEWVMREACKQTLKWHEMGFNNLKVAVNLAEKQLRQENFIATIQNVLEATKLDSRYLELEITETAILDESIINLIKEFKSLGLSLSIDDFGTGYSGLSYFKRFAIDKLKIDQSFIRDIPSNNNSITIVSAIIAMAKELKVKTLAEGVETKEQLDFLKAKGCDYIQGFYYSKPLETSLFTHLLLNYKNLKLG